MIEIRRYHIGVIGSITPDDEMGQWCRYEDIEPLLERIKELEQQIELERSLEDKI